MGDLVRASVRLGGDHPEHAKYFPLLDEMLHTMQIPILTSSFPLGHRCFIFDWKVDNALFTPVFANASFRLGGIERTWTSLDIRHSRLGAYWISTRWEMSSPLMCSWIPVTVNDSRP